jgi:hypothetical protein
MQSQGPEGGTYQPSITDLAWLAGFVDGEGSIHAWIERDRPRIKKGFEVTNTVEANVSRARELIRQLTGRDLRPIERTPRGATDRVSHCRYVGRMTSTR